MKIRVIDSIDSDGLVTVQDLDADAEPVGQPYVIPLHQYVQEEIAAGIAQALAERNTPA